MKNLNHSNNSNFFKKVIFWMSFFCSLLLIFYGTVLNIQKNIKQDLPKTINIKLDGANFKLTPFKEKISAVSYLVGELNSGKVLLEKNSRVHLFPASLSKLLTAMIVLNYLPLDEEVVLSDYAVSAEGDEAKFQENEKYKVEDLLKALLITSSNDAAIALEEAINKKGYNFLDLLEQKLKELKMDDSAFFDSTGLDRKGNFSTAFDLFLLSKEIYKKYPIIGEITKQKEAKIQPIGSFKITTLYNTNKIVDEIENLWGGKTGSTPLAKDCLLTIYEFTPSLKSDKITIVIIVLSSYDRFGDTLKLYQWFKDNLNTSNNYSKIWNKTL